MKFSSRKLEAAKTMIVLPASVFVTDRHSAKADGFTRPAYAHAVLAHQMRNSSPSDCGHHHLLSPKVFQSSIVEHRVRQ